MNQNYLEELNQPQREAVCHTDGPLLILAGAGSGKTRVLTRRIAYLIGEKDVRPWNIMAITFTNKAAEEMRERAGRLVGAGFESIWISTFHSSCVRILRRFIDRIGYQNNFAIYDSDDSRQVMRDVMKGLQLNPKIYRERALLAKISIAKNEMIDADEFERTADDWESEGIAKAYREYEHTLKSNNALDFDDLLVKTVDLLHQDPEVLEYYQEKFRYIMVDEYQDTNSVQFELVRLLSGRYRNLCVVGDDDQSIYKFRGANIRNILEFESAFPDAKVIKLEQNYRSTGRILEAANGVIRNNSGRKEKKLWSALGDGEKVQVHQFDSGHEEAEYVAEEIGRKIRQGSSPSDFAVLYRTNAQSRLFEEAFVRENIPYRLIGGVSFYARKEIKDILAYLKTIDSGQDDVACRRIINVPKRGIGATTVARVTQYAAEENISFYQALLRIREIPQVQRAAARVERFTTMIQRMRSIQEYVTIQELTNGILEDTGYIDELADEDTPEAKARMDNIDELISKIADYENNTDEPTLTEFLQQVSLVSNADTEDPDAEYVLLMTFHGAKGLEFDTVYMTGMDDGIFPGYQSIHSDYPDDLEEERRLCYVGMTRAKRHLILTAARSRWMRGEQEYFKMSRFLYEIPREVVQLDRETENEKRRETQQMASLQEILGMGMPSYGKSSGKTEGGAYGGSVSGKTEGGAYGGRISWKTAAKPAPKFKLREFKVTRADHLDYQEGDRVRHSRFGEGTVEKIADGGKDYEVTVNFDQHGVKKMFASFAKLQKAE